MTIHATATLRAAFGRAVLYDLDHPIRTHVHSALHVLLHRGGAPARYTFEDGDERVSEGSRATLIDPWVPHADFREGGRRSRVIALYVEPGMVHRADGCAVPVSFDARSAELDASERAALERLDEALGTLAAATPGDVPDEGPRGGDSARDREPPGAARSSSASRDGPSGSGDPAVEAAREAEDAFNRLAASLLARHARPSGVARFPARAVLDRHVRRALAHLTERKGRPFDGDALVADGELGRSRLFERFREATGVTPKRYADALRAEEAIAALVATDGDVSAVAARLDFPAPSHLTRFLKSTTGLTPTEHRRAVAGCGSAPVRLWELMDEG